MPGEVGDRVLFQSSPLRYRTGVIAGNITETNADLVVFSDGYGWEHGASPLQCSLFLPQVPFGTEWKQWHLDEPAAPSLAQSVMSKVDERAEVTPAIAVYYSRG